MSPTTTLITFRVRVPRGTRTLILYGSWDNFTTGYSMSKDLQSGSEYWSGCFNFTNIICDGRPSEVMRSRDGGLKMGGTYWYHYKVNDETDFHNVCERATTNCPMMPGQLMNVLNVPFALCGSRSRDPSASSTSSERRTMNPEDKFMNPRPAPSKPEFLRVSTSPTSSDYPGDHERSCTTSPDQETPNASRFLRLPKKRSVDAYTTPSPNSALTGGLRAAFRLRTARSQSPESKADNDLHMSRRAASSERQADVASRDTNPERSRRAQRVLLLRANSDETVSALSFGEHRQKRSASGEHPRPHIAIGVEKHRRLGPLDKRQSTHQPLSALQEVTSPSNNQADMAPADTLVRSEVNLEKRLPTLPNTPSSAYPVSMISGPQHQHRSLDMEALDSHFSATTINTEMQTMSRAINESSHFSAWTRTSDTSAIFVDSSVPVPAVDSSALQHVRWRTNGAANETSLPLSLSYSSMTSSASTSPSVTGCNIPGLDSQGGTEPLLGSAPKAFSPCQVQHYSLPEYDHQSQTISKAPSRTPMGGLSYDTSLSDIKQHDVDSRENDMIHSESMQRLLDELSYLSGIIQQ